MEPVRRTRRAHFLHHHDLRDGLDQRAFGDAQLLQLGERILVGLVMPNQGMLD
jgi:hypothetical protein